MKSLVSQWHWWELFTQLKWCLYFSLNLVYLWLLPFNVRIRCISVIKMEMCLQTPRRTPEFTPLAVLTSSHFFLELEPGWCRQEPTSSCIKKQKLIFCNHGKPPNVRGNRKKKKVGSGLFLFFSVQSRGQCYETISQMRTLKYSLDCTRCVLLNINNLSGEFCQMSVAQMSL